jgi:hypothetical protein
VTGLGPIVFPDVVATVVTGLRAGFVQAGVDVPVEPETAQDLMQGALAIARGLAGATVDGVPVYRVGEDAGADYSPDEESDQPRYVATISVTVKGRNYP